MVLLNYNEILVQTIRMLKIKNKKAIIPNAGEGVEKLDHSL